MTTPPRLARAILRLALPEHQRDNVVGDLDAEYAHHVRPARTAIGAQPWYWWQVLGSLGPAMAMRHRRRRLDAVAPRTSRPDRARTTVDHVGHDLKAGRPLADTAPGIRRRRDCDRRPGHGRELRYLQHRRRRAPAPASGPPTPLGWCASGRPTRAGCRAEQCVSRRLRRSARSVRRAAWASKPGGVHDGDASTLSGSATRSGWRLPTVARSSSISLASVPRRSNASRWRCSGEAVVVVSDRLWRTVARASPAAVVRVPTIDGVRRCRRRSCLHRLVSRRTTSISGFLFRNEELRARDRRTTSASSSACTRRVDDRRTGRAPDRCGAVGRSVSRDQPRLGCDGVSLQDSIVGDVRTPLLVLVPRSGASSSSRVRTWPHCCSREGPAAPRARGARRTRGNARPHR